MAKVRLKDPVTGKFHWVERSALQEDGPALPNANPSSQPEPAAAGPIQDTPAPLNHREPVAAGSTPRAVRPSRPRDDMEEFFAGDGTETVDREDL